MTEALKYPSSYEINRLLDTSKLDSLETSYKRAEILSHTLISKNLSIAFAESITGGQLMSELVRTPGISSVLKGGIVCYQAKTKIDLLGVDPLLIKKHSCESQKISTAIAEGIKKLANPDIAIGITGLASPGASESTSKPIGTVFLSIIYLGKIYQTSIVFKGNRSQIRNKATAFTFKEIQSIISEKEYPNPSLVKKRSITTMGRVVISYPGLID